MLCLIGIPTELSAVCCITNPTADNSDSTWQGYIWGERTLYLSTYDFFNSLFLSLFHYLFTYLFIYLFHLQLNDLIRKTHEQYSDTPFIVKYWKSGMIVEMIGVDTWDRLIVFQYIFHSTVINSELFFNICMFLCKKNMIHSNIAAQCS